MFAKPDTNVVIDDLHAPGSSEQEGLMTTFRASNRRNVAIRVKLNAYTNIDGTKLVMHVRLDDETDLEFIANEKDILKKNEGQVGRFLFDGGYSFESIISECIKYQKMNMCKSVNIISIVRNFHPGSILTALGNSVRHSHPHLIQKNVDELKLCKPFCLHSGQLMLGSSGEIRGLAIHAAVLREG